MTKSKIIKSSIVPYFFISIWGLLFGGGFVFPNLMFSGKVRFFGGEWVEITFLNQVPFLLIGLGIITLTLFNLLHTYWIKADQDFLIIKNLFKRKKNAWSEIEEINSFGRLNFSISKVNTINKKSYYVHLPEEKLNHLLMRYK